MVLCPLRANGDQRGQPSRIKEVADDGFGDRSVAAKRSVDDLGDAEIDGDRHQRVGLVGSEPGPIDEQLRHAFGCHAHRRVEIIAETAGVPMRRGLEHGSVDRHAIERGEPQPHVERCLDRGAASLAVALGEMRIADVEAGTFIMRSGASPA